MSLTVLQTLETLVPETWESEKKKKTSHKEKTKGPRSVHSQEKIALIVQHLFHVSGVKHRVMCCVIPVIRNELNHR